MEPSKLSSELARQPLPPSVARRRHPDSIRRHHSISPSRLHPPLGPRRVLDRIAVGTSPPAVQTKGRDTRFLRRTRHPHDTGMSAAKGVISAAHGAPNADVYANEARASKKANYDSAFMDKLLSPFPGGNLSAANGWTFRWIRWSGSVWPRVWATVVFWTLYTVAIELIAELGGYRQAMSPPSAAALSIFGFAVSLLLGFRTNSAYERWYEGRKLFETATARVREFTRWVTVFYPPKNEEEREKQYSAMRCAVGYLYALMYHLRDENPMEHPDCVDLIPREANGSLATEWSDHSVPRYFFETSEQRAASGVSWEGKGANRMTNFKLPGTWRNPHSWSVPSQMITLLYSYCEYIGAGKSAPGMLVDLANTQVSLERILSTPMPPIYSIHLKQSLLVYFLILPFQFLNWGWWNILLMFISSFIIWGFESMGLELENPFGFDDNDLPLTQLVTTVRREIDFFVEHPVAPARVWSAVVQPATVEEIEEQLARDNGLAKEDLARTRTHLDNNDVETFHLRKRTAAMSSAVQAADVEAAGPVVSMPAQSEGGKMVNMVVAGTKGAEVPDEPAAAEAAHPAAQHAAIEIEGAGHDGHDGSAASSTTDVDMV
ncbi:Bestrophin, RFP-TM, chloride channel-domain-containing protein [Hyaloraphidium curvatum]|nr:Bestrophin, RFP-TM, chloride channel-domain-containing protein [Hyaloraphidium curvatum]